MADAPRDAPRDNAPREQQRRAARENVEKLAQAGRDRQAEAVDEQNARLAGAKPTPTPLELDMAKLGHNVAEKEDDGSGPDFTLQAGLVRKEEEPKVEERRASGPAPAPQKIQPPEKK